MEIRLNEDEIAKAVSDYLVKVGQLPAYHSVRVQMLCNQMSDKSNQFFAIVTKLDS